MPRLIRREGMEPARIVVNGAEQWVCRCGLSKRQPFCDGSHKFTRGEEGGRLYWYDDAGKRYPVADSYADIRKE